MGLLTGAGWTRVLEIPVNAGCVWILSTFFTENICKPGIPPESYVRVHSYTAW